LELSPKQGEEPLKTLKVRFEKNMNRRKGFEWPRIEAKLEAHPEKLSSLKAIESTGREPDVVGYDQKTGQYISYDCQRKVLKAAFVYHNGAQSYYFAL
jgi:hypothetical protein